MDLGETDRERQRERQGERQFIKNGTEIILGGEAAQSLLSVKTPCYVRL
jgi:hypothetical protein